MNKPILITIIIVAGIVLTISLMYTSFLINSPDLQYFDIPHNMDIIELGNGRCEVIWYYTGEDSYSIPEECECNQKDLYQEINCGLPK